MEKNEICPICGRSMEDFDGVSMCVNCNERYGDFYNFFANAVQEFKGSDGRDMIMIDCPGATIYDESNTQIVQGVKWNNPRDFSKGFKIIGRQVFAPNHQHKRVIPREKANNICRCQACQDLTVKMRTFNNQKGRKAYVQDSPMMPRLKPNEDFSPMADERR